MVTLEEMLEFLPDKRLTQIISDLAEQAHSLRLENALHKENILKLKSDVKKIEEKNQDHLEMIDNLKTEFRSKEGEMESKIAALQADIVEKSIAARVVQTEYKNKQAELENDLAKAKSDAAEHKRRLKEMHKLNQKIPLKIEN